MLDKKVPFNGLTWTKKNKNIEQKEGYKKALLRAWMKGISARKEVVCYERNRRVTKCSQVRYHGYFWAVIARYLYPFGQPVLHHASVAKKAGADEKI